MRHAAVIAALFGLALITPATAQDRHPDGYATIDSMADQIDDPDRIDAMGDAMEAMTDAILSMPIGRLAHAASRIDPDSDLADLPDDATVADIADEDGDMAERMGDEARHAGYAMAGMTREMARMLPVFEAMARDMAAQWDDRMERYRRDGR